MDVKDEASPRVTSTARFTPALLGLVPALLAITLIVLGVITRAVRPPQVPDLAGLVRVPIASREHVQGPVRYAQVPPAGGDHAPLWQDCGAYEEPVAAEAAVHSLEHAPCG